MDVQLVESALKKIPTSHAKLLNRGHHLSNQYKSGYLFCYMEMWRQSEPVDTAGALPHISRNNFSIGQ